MQIYLVGGAVRDKLLGLPVTERDWVVTGATPDELTRLGFRQVGRSFPVFLHPETNEEYALARTERKTGPGYHGFEFRADPDVSLEDDLRRRDLTINAMAEDEHGQLIDPYGGQADLETRRLRHVSDAFREDPVRILRVARFAARLQPLGFQVDPDTLKLMREMVAAGEADALVAERVWKETENALRGPSPAVFFQVLHDCGALRVIYPEIDRLFGVPQPADHHPEIDTGVHTLMALNQAARLTPEPEVRFAVLLHDLGKGTTPETEWPRHVGHEKRGGRMVRQLCERIGAPARYRDLAVQVAEHHQLCHRAAELRPSTVLKLLESLDAFRRPDRFEAFLLACEADARGRTGLEDRPYPQADRLRRAREAAAAVTADHLREQGLSGPQLGEAIRQARLTAVTQAIATSNQKNA